MKKLLLSCACAAMIAPAFNASAGEASITEVWRYMTNEYNADWIPSDQTPAPQWDADEVMPVTCTRMGFGRDGKIYTVNMKTMSIAEITKDGFKDVYKLPSLKGRVIDGIPDVYGTAISMDQAGNFLIGHCFTRAPYSSTVWTVYNPENGTHKHFELSAPTDLSDDGLTANKTIGRIDCVGRVIGDLTDNAIFYIAPGGAGYAQVSRIVYAYGEEAGDASKTELYGDEFSPGMYLGTSQQNIAQPKYDSYEEIDDEGALNSFIMVSREGSKWDQYLTFVNEKLNNSINDALKNQTGAKTKGFDTFVLGGKRYYVINYLDATDPNYAMMGKGTMNIGVFNEKGVLMAEWKNNDYEMTGSSSGGYSSITAEPLDNGTANIYVYNSNKYSAAAMLNFMPASDDAIPGTIANPYKISTPRDLVEMAKRIEGQSFFATIENDIDMSGVTYTVPFKDGSTVQLYLDGKNHVISNLTVLDGNASLLGVGCGVVENLGLENVNLNKLWFCTGAIAGQANGLTIKNCYATGDIYGAASGGLVGSNAGDLVIEDSYSQANVTDEAGGHAGGLVGRIDGNLSISNAYASGAVAAKNFAGGIGVVRNSSSVKLANVIAWNPTVDCEAEAATAVSATVTNCDFLDETNVFVWDGMKVNGADVENGTSAAALQATATAWEAYNEEVNAGKPVLAWQEADGNSGINDITVDDNSDAAPVYYNLQGVKIANPGNGIFIVRRGNKVAKEIVR